MGPCDLGDRRVTTCFYPMNPTAVAPLTSSDCLRRASRDLVGRLAFSGLAGVSGAQSRVAMNQFKFE